MNQLIKGIHVQVKKSKLLWIVLGILMLASPFSLASEIKENCQKEPQKTYKLFKKELITFVKMASLVEESKKTINSYLQKLEKDQLLPFTCNNMALLIYYGEAKSVAVAGDFNGWDSSQGKARNIEKTSLWLLEMTLPVDARVDYKWVIDGHWINDPRNSYLQWSGFGANSELRMPEWKYPTETLTKIKEKEKQGILQEQEVLESVKLNYKVGFNVYIPYNYKEVSGKLPVIYVTDGHEYAHDRLGSMKIILDNLIYEKKMKPVMAVFLDPRDVETGINRRYDELVMNHAYAQFVTEELVPYIDKKYKTDKKASSRAILGTSLGGIFSSFIGLHYHETFQLIGVHSPALYFAPTVLTGFRKPLENSLKLFISTGNIFDTEEISREFYQILKNNKQHEVFYEERPQGHSWGNWRSSIGLMLTFFWGL